MAADPAAARLGKRLFFETRLSADGRVSCSTCHDPIRSFTDGKNLSIGQRKVQRHTPSLWNVAYGRWLFWDGRADSLWSQALKPIESADEMGGSRLQSVRLLAADSSLRSAYQEAFGPLPDLRDLRRFPKAGGPAPPDPSHPKRRAWDSMSEVDRVEVSRVFVNVGKAIAAFERQLVSRRSPFDVFAEGLRTGDTTKTSALSEPAQRGLKLYMHQGQLVTLRDVLDYYSTLGGQTPPLVEAAHLEVALLPLRLSESEIEALSAFLESLTDARSVEALEEPPGSVPTLQKGLDEAPAVL